MVSVCWCGSLFQKAGTGRCDSTVGWKKTEVEGKSKITLVQIWLGVLALGVAVLVIMLIDANALGHGSRYGSLGNYLVFNDGWGTMRGYIWRKSLELYAAFPFMHKLFGFGPDTFGL